MSERGGTLAQIATDVRNGRRSAVAITKRTIADIRARDGAIGAVTRLLESRALADAARIDREVAAGRDPGPLAGVPFGVKDLFDVAGLPNTAGSRLRESAPAATEDAEAVRRLRDAGAILVATLNMDEFAYGFATVNAFHGTTCNPHDRARLAGGSSGGSAAAVAAGLLPLTLGSDTNGSIRVPAALCGVYGLKPTHGTLPLGGVAPFVESFDDIGPFTGSLADLRLATHVLSRGKVGTGAASTERIGRLGGWFARNLTPEVAQAMDAVAQHLEASEVELPEVGAARSAAYVMTAMEGGALHLPELHQNALAFDPATRDRLLAGALMPGAAYFDAQRFRRWFADEAAALFERVDVLLAPATATVAPLISAPSVEVDGQSVPARAHLGLYTQPISFIGLPSLAVPLYRPGKLPLGLQLVAAPSREAGLFALAARLEEEGLTGVSAPLEEATVTLAAQAV